MVKPLDGFLVVDTTHTPTTLESNASGSVHRHSRDVNAHANMAALLAPLRRSVMDGTASDRPTSFLIRRRTVSDRRRRPYGTHIDSLCGRTSLLEALLSCVQF